MRAHLTIAFVVYRFLLFPVTIALVVISFFHPMHIDGYGVRAILIALWAVVIVGQLGLLVHDGWTKWSAR